MQKREEKIVLLKLPPTNLLTQCSTQLDFINIKEDYKSCSTWPLGSFKPFSAKLFSSPDTTGARCLSVISCRALHLPLLNFITVSAGSFSSLLRPGFIILKRSLTPDYTPPGETGGIRVKVTMVKETFLPKAMLP